MRFFGYLSLLLLGVVDATPIARRAMYSWREFKSVSKQLDAALPWQPYQILPGPTPIPAICARFTKTEGCDISLMTAVEVLYEDAPTSWVFCHCSDASFTAERVIEEFGRLPVGMRQSVRHIMGFPMNRAPMNLGGGARWTRDIEIWNLEAVDQLLLHEAAHLLDMWGLTDKYKMRYSEYPEFAEAIKADNGCTATPYTESSYKINNLAEVWADTFMFQRYVVAVHAGKIPDQWEPCIANQLRVIREQTDYILRFPYRSDKQIPKDISISDDNYLEPATFEDEGWICEK